MWISAAFVLGEVIACLWNVYRDAGRLFWPAALVPLLFGAVSILWKNEENQAGVLNPGNRALRLLLLLLLFSLAAGGMAGYLGSRETPLEKYLDEQELLGREEQESGEPFPLSLPAEAAGYLEAYSEKDGRITLRLSDAEILTGGRLFREQMLLVTSDEAPEAEYGDRLAVSGRVSLPARASNPGQFDYRNYYRGLGIRVRLKASFVSPDESGRQRVVPPGRRMAGRVKRRAERLLKLLYPEDDAGFFRAVLLGDRSSLPEETGEVFRDAGISHILAVSGLHVSLVGMAVFRLIRRLGAGFGLSGAVSSLLLLFYGFLTGFGPSVFRAVFMLVISLLAAYLGRTFDMGTAMAVALVILSAGNPFLLFLSGVQLSFGAVFVIACVLESNRKLFHERPGGASVLMGLAIPLGTLPIVLSHSYEFAVYGFFLNLLVLPLMTWTVGSGFLALFTAFLAEGLYDVGKAGAASMWMVLAAGAGGPGYYLYHFFCRLGLAVQNLPVPVLIGGKPGMLPLMLYLAAFFRLFTGNKENEAYRRKLGRAAVFLITLVLLLAHPNRGLKVTFLDVGQGDGAVIRAENTVMISDCGSSSNPAVGEQVLVPFLKSSGIRRVDKILVSHSDTDHTNGILYLLDQVPEIDVGEVCLPGAAEEREEYGELIQACQKRKIPVRYTERGAVLEGKTFRLTFLSPPEKKGVSENPNSDSLVFCLEYRGSRFLFTGDIGAEEEKELLENTVLPDISVLKTAHHGSGGSSGEEFLSAVSPEAAVISCGKGNSYGHPAGVTLKRLRDAGARIYRTARDGAVTFTGGGKKLRVRTFRGKNP